MRRIEIVGLLGAGKTTLLDNIKDLNYPDLSFCYERISPLNDVWNLVKKTNSNYFLLQSCYYLESLQLIKNKQISHLMVSDFSLRIHHYVYSSWLFKHNLINELEWRTLNQLLDLSSSLIAPVTGLIFINANTSELKQNLDKRNRDLDSGTSIDYLNELSSCLDENWSNIIAEIPILNLNTNELRNWNPEIVERLNIFIESCT